MGCVYFIQEKGVRYISKLIAWSCEGFRRAVDLTFILSFNCYFNIIRKHFDQKKFSTPHQSHLISWHHFESYVNDLYKNLKNFDVSINNLYNCYLEMWIVSFFSKILKLLENNYYNPSLKWQNFNFLCKKGHWQSQWWSHMKSYYQGISNLVPNFMNVALLVKIFEIASNWPHQPEIASKSPALKGSIFKGSFNICFWRVIMIFCQQCLQKLLVQSIQKSLK